MALNARMQKLIEEARIKTMRMREEAEARKTATPETVVALVERHKQENMTEMPVVGNTTMTIGGNTFDPYTFSKEDGTVIHLNTEQRQAVDWFGLMGKSGCLIGPAGTGKTTTMQAIIEAAIKSGRIPIIPTADTHKYVQTGKPGIWGGSFTRIATRNLRDNVPEDIKSQIHTIHRLLEYEPEFVTVDKLDANGNPTGETKEVRIFRPQRHRLRKLSESLVTFFVDESSMLGTMLHTNLIAAIGAKNAQIVYIGDIAQLPPVMDDSILGYKLLELPVVELTHVYRHAGRIVNLANHIRTGNTIPPAREIMQCATNLRLLWKDKWLAKVKAGIEEWNGEEDGSKVTIHLWKNRLDGEVGQLQALQALGDYDYQRGKGGFFPEEIKAGNYDPMEHMILMPYNKAVGTLELNKYIANFLGRARGAVVHEVIAGYLKHYLAVGDKVFYDREEAVITKINVNASYGGKLPQAASVTLDRWGHNQAGIAQEVSDQVAFDNIDALMKGINVTDDEEERKNQASHVIYVKKLRDIEDGKDHKDYEDEGSGQDLSTASEINGLLGGYALTVHKSQGSQWPKVYCVFHNSHNRNLQRELLYTAITRAQKELYVIAEPETFVQGVTSQHIVGNTLAAKAEYFKGKALSKKNRDDLFAGNGNENGNDKKDDDIPF